MKRHVLHHLHENPAETEHQHRPELRIARHAQDHLSSLPAHLLHVHALDPRLGHSLADPQHHQVERVPDFLRRGKAELHAPHVGLVDDVRREDLHGNGVPAFFRRFHRPLRGVFHLAGRYVEIVGAENGLCVGLAHLQLPALHVTLNDPLHSSAVHGEACHNTRRTLFPPGVFTHGPQRVHGPFGRRVIRKVRRHQLLSPRHHVRASHEARQHRFVPARARGHGAGRLRGSRHRLRGQDHDHGVHAVVAQRGFQRRLVPSRVGVPKHVDRVPDTRRGGKLLSQGRGRRSRQCHHLHP